MSRTTGKHVNSKLSAIIASIPTFAPDPMPVRRTGGWLARIAEGSLVAKDLTNNNGLVL